MYRIHSPLMLVAYFALSPALEAGAARGERHCALPRGTRGKAQWQSGFQVPHLAAGGIVLPDTKEKTWQAI